MIHSDFNNFATSTRAARPRAAHTSAWSSQASGPKKMPTTGRELRLAEVHRWLGACCWGVALTVKAKTIAYWTTAELAAIATGRRAG